MIKVWTYSGHRGDERPVKLELNGVEHEIMEVLDRWCGGEADYFKVKTRGGVIYILRLDRFDGMWDLEGLVK